MVEPNGKAAGVALGNELDTRAVVTVLPRLADAAASSAANSAVYVVFPPGCTTSEALPKALTATVPTSVLLPPNGVP
jgi:hypothetical protein